MQNGKIENLRELLVKAMDRLSDDHPDFGSDRMGEKRFQEALTRTLRSDFALSVDPEVRIPSDRFWNESTIIPDHIIHDENADYAIELKYVYCPDGKPQPNDPQGFPWDILKDCAKLEALIDDPEGKASQIQNGIVIGLTDFNFWSDIRRDWWSHHYLLPEAPDWQVLAAPSFFETKATKRRCCIRAGISFNKRSHIKLAHEWQYKWFNYEGRFRYIMLCRTGGEGRLNLTLAEARQNAAIFGQLTVPFRDAQHRAESLAYADRFNAAYLANDKNCPVHEPGPALGHRPFVD